MGRRAAQSAQALFMRTKAIHRQAQDTRYKYRQKYRQKYRHKYKYRQKTDKNTDTICLGIIYEDYSKLNAGRLSSEQGYENVEKVKDLLMRHIQVR